MLVNSPSDFDIIEIGLASPDRIRYWSHGEIEKPETINYRTFKPERKGLFCEKIFGPVKDWECSCGKYRRVRYRGIVCERCGVEVTHSKVRRERMGHIELAADVAHIWFLKGIPSYMGLVLEMSARQLEEVIYYDSYIVLDVAPELAEAGTLHVKQTLSTTEYMDLKEKYGDRFKAEMGASAIKKLLQATDLKQLTAELRKDLVDSKGQKKLKVIKRLRVVESLYKSGNRPEWMIMEVIPVMPPDLRPMVQLEGGRFATSDLNDLYRRVVNRNNRLKRLMDIGAPEMIVRNEKRMLQEAVDVLISNGKRGRSVTGSNGRPLKSLGNIIEGKQGRFRQNLLGKRVDYSGRSVIVVGPHLKFHQCGLPKEMALELFKPFVIRKLVENGVVSNVKSAKRKIERRDVIVWDVLEGVIKGQCVLLNRAPTLHRLGIQAFQPILVEGSAIQIHPLVCTAFNADFDGDQMAVHVPLSLEAQAESRLLIMSTNNILSPSNGRSIITPTQDMVLGCYFLTVDNPDATKGRGKAFGSPDEAMRAWELNGVDLQASIVVRYQGKRVTTTLGRLLFNIAVLETLEKYGLHTDVFVNQTVGKKEMSDLVFGWYTQFGNEVTAELADKLKNLGFRYSTQSGISISIDDLKVPKSKKGILDKAEAEIRHLDDMVASGSITPREKQLRTIDIWRGATHQISDEMQDAFGPLNNVFIMANSGARGNIDQVRQLAGMRGLMSDSQGRILVIPIKSNFREGMTLTEYFNACYGARKGLVDTALRTADSGYLTRRLVDVAQDVLITEEDCETTNGIDMQPVQDGVESVVSLAEQIDGRISLETIAQGKKTIVSAGELISGDVSRSIQDSGRTSFKVRHPYTCKAKRGICQKCYGLDLASGRLINVGEAVGIIAAQSIGEPGTQLTMRTFHTGGVDLRRASKVEFKAKFAGKISFDETLTVSPARTETGEQVVVVTGESRLYNNTKTGEKRIHLLPKGSHLMVKEGDNVNPGDILAEYDPAYEYVVCHRSGVARFFGLDLVTRKSRSKKGTEVYTQTDGEIFVNNPDKEREYEIYSSLTEDYRVGDRIKVGTEIAQAKTLDVGGIIARFEDIPGQSKKKTKNLMVKMVIVPGESYPVLSGARLFASEGDRVREGDILARERVGESDASKTTDIVQGLPRVEELFEARKPKNSAILSYLTGVVEIAERDGNRFVVVTAPDGEQQEYKVPFGSRVKVFSGKRVEKGDVLTEGVINPFDIMDTRGVYATQTYLSDEIQKVYRSQGVKIHSKHVEVIVRQMTRKVNVSEMGDSEFLPSELIDIRTFESANESLRMDGKKVAEGARVLLGITRSSLNTESFISASSFQETARVLADAAVKGKTDEMYGLKENVIIGKLIPAGTGLAAYGRVSLKSLAGEEIRITEEERIFSVE